MSVTYKQSGVDIEAGDELVRRIKPLALATRIPEVVDDVGGFAGMVRLPADIPDPLLVSGTDGVGTKLKLAFATGKHDTVGQDLVAMCVNDVITTGARPLYFLDYFGCGKLEVDVAEQVVKGIADGCKLAGCALIGGETAELPSMYPEGEYDLAGFAVGVVEKADIIDGSRIVPGDVVLGLASSGAHSNGYSLIRKIVERAGTDMMAPFHGRPFRDVVMEPTRIYVKPMLELMRAMPGVVKGMAHITGGGITENVPRILREELTARIDGDTWALPQMFRWLQFAGGVNQDEMYRVFNCGIGMVVIVSAAEAEAAEAKLTAAGETVYRIGVIDTRREGEAQTIID